MTMNYSATVKPIPREKLTTIGGRYTEGDTKIKPQGNVKITNNDYDDWQAGFDKIDIAPKDGQLSREEICDYRDKQVSQAKFLFWSNPKNWFNFEKQYDFRCQVRDAERKTAEFKK